MSRLLYICVVSLVSVMLTGCFTGVETTQKITDRDVQRALQEMERGKREVSIAQFADSLPHWSEGKGFWVVDDRARLIFQPSASYDIDSLQLLGKRLTYVTYNTHRQVDNSEVVDIIFNDTDSNRLVYATGKPFNDVSKPSFVIPFLVDDDMVQNYARQLVGKTVYVKTAVWFDGAGNYTTGGRKFVPVEITAVKAGNDVYPLMVAFRDGAKEATLWMTTDDSPISGHHFDDLFSMTDVRKQYSRISDENWQRIVEGKVAEGMTKEECRLAMGNPKNLTQLPDQSGLREYWYYDGGRYLFFVDGLLKEFR